MKRLIINSALAVTLATGIFLFWPSADESHSRGESAAPPGSRAILPRIAGEDKPSRKARERSLSAVHPFVKRSEEIAAMPQTTERENAIRSLAREWAAEEPAPAESWAASLSEQSDRERALTHVCLTVADRHPLDAIGIARRYDLGEGMVEMIVGRWAESDFGGAALWVDGLPVGEARDGLLAKLALFRAEADPAEAASMVSSSMTAGKVQEEAAISVLHQWLHQDTEAAARWIDAFPEGDLKDRALKEIQGMTAYLKERQTER